MISFRRAFTSAMLMLLVPYFLGCGSSQPPSGGVGEVLAAGRQQEQKLQLLSAEKTYQDGLRRFPHQVDLLKALATLYAASFRFEDSRRVAHELATEHRGQLASWPQALIRAFDSYESHGYGEARQAIADSIQQHPTVALLHVQMADLAINYYTHQGRRKADLEKIADAESSLRRALSMQPPSADYYFVLGEVSMAKGDWNGGHELYDKALAIGGWSEPWLHWEALMGAGFMALHQGNLDGGRRQLTQCLQGLEHWENFHAAQSKPFREMILASMHVYFGNEIPTDRLQQFQLDYQKLDDNKVEGPLNQVRGEVLQTYQSLNAGRLDEALLTTQEVARSLQGMTACPTALLVFRHWNFVLMTELGDAAYHRQRYQDAATYYGKSSELFPTDRLIMQRLDQIKPLMNNSR